MYTTGHPIESAYSAVAAGTGVASGKSPSVLQKKATELVNQVFFGTLLREFRESRQPTMLDGGPGASVFVRQLDQAFIERMSQGQGSRIARALMQQLTQGYVSTR